VSDGKPRKIFIRDENDQFRFKPDFAAIESRLLQDVARFNRQQAHLDEIKHLCHVHN